MRLLLLGRRVERKGPRCCNFFRALGKGEGDNTLEIRCTRWGRGGEGFANGLSRRISGIQCSDGSGGGGLGSCVTLGEKVCALLDVDVFGGGGGGGAGGPA